MNVTHLTREDGFVVELGLHPGHQKIDVLRSGDFQRGLHVLTIGPEVLEFGAGRHEGACLFCAELCEGAVEDGDLVVKLDGVHGQPFVEVLT